MKRSSFNRLALTASGAAAAGVGFVRFPSDAAEFEYKFAHSVPLTNPMHVHLVRAFDDVRTKTNGRLNVEVFGNNMLGGDAAILGQVRSGAIQFIMASGSLLSTLDLPVAGVESVGFAFRNEEQFLRTMDGPLGALIRKQLESKDVMVYPNVWSLGPRAITVNPHPIAEPDDFRGLKLRVPPAKIVYDLFSTLGVTPTPVEASGVYLALQTHIIDGVELALAVLYDLKMYEVQKYLSLTNEICAGQWVVANPQAINALPPDIRSLVANTLAEEVKAERTAVSANSATTTGKLKEKGMIVNAVDVIPMRARLSAYYARWRPQIGETAWTLLEQSVGKLG